jgi:hypothetical protein
MTNKKRVYAFGDNSAGQIEAQKEYAMRKARRLEYLEQVDENKVTEIHAGEMMSAITTQFNNFEGTKKYYAWGGKNII